MCSDLAHLGLEGFLQSISEKMPALQDRALDYALTLPCPDGLVIELGVYTGRSIKKIAEAMPDVTVYGFDSFEGLPENLGRPDMSFDAGAFSLKGNLPSVPSNVRLVAGLFDTTLPTFARDNAGEKLAFVHVDCDLYSSTKCVFDQLGHMFKNGTVIVFDELLNYPTFEKHEVKAFYEFLCQSGYGVEWIGKLGPVDLHPVKDTGSKYQSVACRLV